MRTVGETPVTRGQQSCPSIDRSSAGDHRSKRRIGRANQDRRTRNASGRRGRCPYDFQGRSMTASLFEGRTAASSVSNANSAKSARGPRDISARRTANCGARWCPAPGFERMRTVGATNATRSTDHHRLTYNALIARTRDPTSSPAPSCPLEFLRSRSDGGGEKCTVLLIARGDEVFALSSKIGRRSSP